MLKGITFAKMYDTFWQKPFYIKITWLLNLTDVIFNDIAYIESGVIISMVEDVKGRGGSGYVVGKEKEVMESWFSGNE